jgi:cobalamin biosynthesis protein CbiD
MTGGSIAAAIAAIVASIVLRGAAVDRIGLWLTAGICISFVIAVIWRFLGQESANLKRGPEVLN